MDGFDAYDLWLGQVDRAVVQHFGVGIDDLPDQPYMDFFEDGYAPSDVVEALLEEGLG